MARKPNTRPEKRVADDEPARGGLPSSADDAPVVAAQPQPKSTPTAAMPSQEPATFLTPLAAVWPEATTQEPSRPAPTTRGSAPAPTVKTKFVLFHPDARQVSLCGDFNHWAPKATLMKRDPSGNWEVTLDLCPGRYQYKFVVDGQWVPDPQAREQIWNLHGTLNSIIEVRA